MSVWSSPRTELAELKSTETSVCVCVCTVSKELQDGKVHLSLPTRVFLDGDAVAGGSEDFPRANGDQLTALVSARHVIQHCSIINERIQLPVIENTRHSEHSEPTVAFLHG